MNGLALCAGIGGIELGIKLVYPSYRTICYVEGEAYAVANLVARMEDGHLDQAPIWSDLRTFDATAWRGKVDIVTAGFPCQPFSVAGKQRAEKDPRHLWPDIARIITECEPSLVFLENVNKRAFVEPHRDLRTMGFTLSDPFACTAAELGAGHLRRRIFVLAWNSQYQRRIQQERVERTEWGRISDTAKTSDSIIYSTSEPEREQANKIDTTTKSREARRESSCSTTVNSTSQRRGEGWTESESKRCPNDTSSIWWASESGMERVVHGLPNRVDRDRALGNAVVPAMAAFAFKNLVIGSLP